MSEGQATATKSTAPDPLIGRVIADRFKITSLIARGGMGKVYRAEQAPLGRLCAIKVLNPNYNGDADPEFHRRFFREASITSKITHPNSVTIFDYGKTDDDIYFMAMEYLEGLTLHMALRQCGVMHEVRVGRIAAQICRAVREAHKLGVIHRDLKPANIFLTRPNARPVDASGTMPPPSEEDEDFVKVLDFGLVKHLGERPEEQLTQTGLFMGSPKYMAPEQIQGGHVDERTDIYSLGIMLYEMLAGKVPFERATSVNILMAHVGEPPPPMRAVNPNLVCSPAFEEIVMSCIAKDPNQRLSSMDDLIGAIRRAHGGSLTGQLAAVNASGPFAMHGSAPPPMVASYPPPPMVASYPPPPMVASYPPPAMATASGSHAPMGTGSHAPMGTGSHTPMGVIRSEPSNDTSSVIEMRPRSKLWILFGVLTAAVLGGGLGMLAFHWSAPRTSGSAALSPSTPPSAVLAPVATNSEAPASTVSVPASATPALVETLVILKITTDPSGASIREDGREICVATPCDLMFKGETEATTKTHKLLIMKGGFRAETRVVKASESPVHVKLAHVGVRPAAPVAPPTPASKPDSTTVNGFKDVPY